MIRRILSGCVCLTAAVVLNSCQQRSESPVAASADGPGLAPLRMAVEQGIPGQYVVVLKNPVQQKGSATTQSAGATRARVLAAAGRYGVADPIVYDVALQGFAAALRDDQVIALRRDNDVDFIEQDRYFSADKQTTPAGITRIGADVSSTIAGDGKDSVRGVEVFIIDTGIDPSHPDLNVVETKTFVKGTKTGVDDNGHGTHVAGTVAARDNSSSVVGVAPGARLHAVKVLNAQGNGAMSEIINGINYVAAYKTANPTKACVANMSLGGYAGSTAYGSMDLAVKTAIQGGTTFCIAAGNSAADAGLYTPAHVWEAITVAAYDASDNTFAVFSNYGSVVDIAAPGVNVTSTYKGGGTATMSGTSMATPHVTGAVALYLSAHPAAIPSVVAAAIGDAARIPAQVNPNGSSTTLPLNPLITNVPNATKNLSVYAGNF